MRLVMIDTIQADFEDLHRRGQGGLGVGLWSNLRRRIILDTRSSYPEDVPRIVRWDARVEPVNQFQVNSDNSSRL